MTAGARRVNVVLDGTAALGALVALGAAALAATLAAVDGGALTRPVAGLGAIAVASLAVGLAAGHRPVLVPAFALLSGARVLAALDEPDGSLVPLWVAAILVSLDAACWSLDARGDAAEPARAAALRSALTVSIATGASTAAVLASRWAFSPGPSVAMLGAAAAAGLLALVSWVARRI